MLVPYTSNYGLIWVGDTLESGISRCLRKHTAMEGLLWHRVICWIKFTWHYFYRNTSL